MNGRRGGSREHWTFRLEVAHAKDGWHAAIYVADERRAACHGGGSIDATLRMMVPYLATYCEPEPFADLFCRPGPTEPPTREELFNDG